MKKIFVLFVFIVFVAGLDLYSQSLSNTTISGIFTEAKTLTGNFDADEDTLTAPSYSYTWLRYSSTGTLEQDLNDNSVTHLIAGSEVGKRLKFVVHLTNSYADTVISDTSLLSPVIITNSAPTASNVTIAVPSNLNVGSTLICTYNYADEDGDLEDNTTFQWRRADTETGSYSNISGATNYAYVIQLADTGRWFKVVVNPDALTGDNNSTTYTSATASGPVQNAPYVDEVSLPSTIQSGNNLTVSYSFHDPDGDGDDSEFTWYRDNVEIPGATGDTYAVVTDDQGAKIKVIITPISDNGYPNQGDDVESNECDVEISALPLAEGVCISGNRSDNAWLTGVYSYDANGSKNEGATRLMWYVNDILVKSENRWASQANKLQLTGGRENDKIVFKVVPKTVSPQVIGDTVASSPLTSITNTKINYSVSEVREELTALPSVDKFLGDGVVKDGGIYYFDPGHNDVEVGTPNQITHQYTDAVCTQNAYIDFNVDSATVFFDSRFRSYFCYEDTDVTIGVTGLPANYVANSGQFILSPAVPGGILSSTDQTVRINPQAIGPGVNQAVLLYQYFQRIELGLPGLFYDIPFIIARPMIIEFIDQNLSIGNIPLEYCEEGEKLTAISLNKSPSGGTGDWTSPLVISENSETALLDPAATGPGLKTISYTYTTQIGCSKMVTTDILINPTPQLDFDIVDGCIENDNDTTMFINSSNTPGLMESWFWEFGEAITQVSESFEPGFMYRTEGRRDVTLIGTTLKGCKDTLIKEIALGVKPEGDFYWEDDCFSPGTDLKLFDQSKPNSTIDSLFWVFNHSLGSDTTFNVLNPTFAKQTPELLNVEYYLLTKYAGCYDTVVKDIFIRPTYVLKDADYFEDFEGVGLGWVVDSSVISTWELGLPEYLIGATATGNAWFTDTLTSGFVDYAVESPCFDFREVKRPMMSLDIVRHLDEGRNGAVLQYKVGNDPVWENIGGTDFGIEWYDNSNITGRPGGSVVGWSSEIKDAMFYQARQYLDDLIDLEDVKLRISYGSDGSAQDSRGFAFDNVNITERKRNVLVENFTNYNEPGFPGTIRKADSIINVIMNNVAGDAMNIQYHTNYYPDDRLYLDNTAVPSARMLFYGISRNPIAIYDGGWNPDKFAKKYRFDGDNAKENDLRNESMVDPLFDISVDTLASHEFEVTIEPLKDIINAENVTLFIAIVAKEITTLTGTNGQTVFRNVLRKMTPDAGGIPMKKSWLATEGETVMGPYSRSVPWIYDSNDIEVIAFLQNNITKEVYQAASSGSFKANVTSISRVKFEEAEFSIFPNPASNQVTLLFDRELIGESRLIIYNSTSVVVREERLDAGSDRLTIDDLSLPSGVYFIRVDIDGKPSGFRKLIIAGR